MITIGIDPGLQGAIAVLMDGNFIAVHDMPTVVKSNGRSEVNPKAMKDLINSGLNSGHDIEVALEKVSAMPGQGVSGVFSFGDSYGCCRSVIAVMGLRTNLISPAVWKHHFKLGKDKEQSRALAVRLFPEAPLHLKKYVDRAEALLIAMYLWELKFS